jgi:hypothetical protein
MRLTPQKQEWSAHGWLGVGLVIVFWILNWSLPGLRTDRGFFFLWLGYCLTVDALILMRKGNSPLTRSPRAYVGLFLASAPAWWLFELINWRTQNWHYVGREHFTDLQYFVLASLSFSTVMPAVFSTAELVSTLGWIRRVEPGPQITSRPETLRRFSVSGGLMLALTLWAGGLICGFFWEMWNFHSYPKWVYQVPGVDFWRIFEMPLLGYGGYLPFALELFALYHLVAGLFRPGKVQDFVRISPDSA